MHQHEGQNHPSTKEEEDELIEPLLDDGSSVCKRACEDDRGKDWEFHAPKNLRKKIPLALDREQLSQIFQTAFFITPLIELCVLFRSDRFSQTVAGAPSSPGFLDQDVAGLQFLDVTQSRVRRALRKLRILG